ncbi:MAG: NAD-dependent epimerase/dehydratase family protein [Cyclobacteriaceae bacterium]
MKIFLTGTSGLLGNNTAIELLKRGYYVKGLFRHESEAALLERHENFELFFGDITDRARMMEGVKGCDAVIHTAADTAQWPDRSPLFVATNVEGTRNVMEAAKAAGVKRGIFVSTANSLGFGTKENPGDEKSPPKFARYGIGYMETKYEAQQIVLKEARENGYPFLVVNPTFMIGPRDYKPSSGQMVLAVAQGKVPGYPSGGKNYVYVGDVAVAIANALEMGRPGECYLLGNENLSYREMFTKIAKVVGVKPPGLAIPPWATLAFGMIGTISGKLFGITPKVSYKMAKVSCDGHYFSARKAIEELKMPQTPIETAIKECYEWFKAHGYLNKA